MKCSQCNRTAQTNGSGYCWPCDPDVSEQDKRRAQSRGGSRSRKIREWAVDEIPEIQDIQDLRALYNATLHWLLSSRISPAQATALCRVGGGLREIFELELIERALTMQAELMAPNREVEPWQLTGD